MATETITLEELEPRRLSNAGKNPVDDIPLRILADENEQGDTPRLADEDDNSTQYPSGIKLFWIMLSLVMTLLLGGWDANIIATAVPSITDHFHSIADVGWYYTAYRLTSSSFQFGFGKLYKMYSMKHVFLVSVVILLLGAILCATAISSHMFILGRAVTGLGIAGGSAGCFTLLTTFIPLRKRPVYSSAFGMIEGVMSLAAPAIGGAITQKLSWRWCFWINVPMCILSLIGIVIFLPSDHRRRSETADWKETVRQLDLVGTLILLPSLSALFIALSWAGTKYAWGDPKVIALFVVFAVLLGVFVLDQIVKGDAAILPGRVMKKRNVIGGFIFSLTLVSALDVLEYYMPTFFQAVHGYSPARSGLMTLPLLIGTMVGIMIQGSGTSHFGYVVPFMIAGSVLLPIAAGLQTTWTPNTSVAKLIVYAALVGFGGGIGWMGPQTSVQTALTASDAPLGLSVVMFAQNFGPALFVTVAQLIFTNRLGATLHILAPNLSAINVESMGLTEIKTAFSGKSKSEVLLAFSESLSQTWYLAIGLACVSMVGALITEWQSVKDKEE